MLRLKRCSSARQREWLVVLEYVLLFWDSVVFTSLSDVGRHAKRGRDIRTIPGVMTDRGLA